MSQRSAGIRVGLAGAGLLAVTALGLATSAAATAAPAHAATRANTAAKTHKLLAGKIVGIDPGHNGKNYTDPAFLNHQIWNGREWEDCDTTGTETDGGYTEAKFNWLVASELAKILRKDGAKVVMTRKSNDGIGPCVNTRARILDRAHANVSIDIHADGGPASGRGFTVLEPVADGPNDKVIKSSIRFGKDVHQAFTKDTPMMVSDYYGHDGYIFRNDLAGLNLTTMPKVLIECGNMRNSADAKLLTSVHVQREIAYALAQAIIRFLVGH
ncbi:MAG TPA: N-acetylmuramoyl-L-alanine amidase [Streptosporangiaceae bacterium]|nr:N-acetylmuramoyl-L-alanine amidase [Streptosporangiaceae bacterium]